jgi:hypothetical protein
MVDSLLIIATEQLPAATTNYEPSTIIYEPTSILSIKRVFPTLAATNATNLVVF